MNMLYQTIGITKQAVQQHQVRQCIFESNMVILLAEFESLRKSQPGCGLEKAYYTLQPKFIGRDNFIEVFRTLGYKINKKINYHRTTYSVPSNYPNLITGILVNSPSMVWQSDITYIKIGDNFYYAVFIIDVYTKKIVGYSVSDNMRAEANVKAFNMALVEHKAPKIHHSDHGSQYIYSKYVELLKENKCKISMSKSAQENAYAERINRTIKEEFIIPMYIKDFKELQTKMKEIVWYYNNKRIHLNLKRLTPVEFEQKMEKQRNKYGILYI